MKKIFPLLVCLALLYFNTRAQVAINKNGTPATASAILDIQDTAKGLLVPRMTEAQRLNIDDPAASLIVYQTTGDKGFYYNSTNPVLPVWKKIGSDAIPTGGIVISETFPNTLLENNGYTPCGMYTQTGTATYGNYGRWTPCKTINAFDFSHGTVAAVWTGTYAVYYGGDQTKTEGKRYNPANDSWLSVQSNAGTELRTDFSWVWTGTELVIWGGETSAGDVGTGARYTPATNSWYTMSNTNAPSPRRNAKMFWTGTEIIIYGGETGFNTILNTGAKYNPANDTWTAISMANAPQTRDGYSAIMAGNKMVIWGGKASNASTYYNTGYIYNPATNTWSQMSISNPPAERKNAFIAWTGTEILIFGGTSPAYNFQCQCYLDQIEYSGGKYNLSNNSWTTMATDYGPIFQSGSFYKAAYANDAWVFFDKGGSCYKPSTNTWSKIPIGPTMTGNTGPAIVTPIDNYFMIWGSFQSQGVISKYYQEGSIYNPATNTWAKEVSKYGPPATSLTIPLYTGTELIVYGGPTTYTETDALASRYNLNAQGFGNAQDKTYFLYKKN